VTKLTDRQQAENEEFVTEISHDVQGKKTNKQKTT